jgi:hypothetical protein
MIIDPALQLHIRRSFAPLNNEAAVNSFPPAASLSQNLTKIVGTRKTGAVPSNLTPAIAKMFTTASVNMWMRAVHSFLISTSLTNVSPIWASVAGYYSSHYSVRAIAHLLGFFQLFAKRRIVQLEIQAGHFVCKFNSKKADDREHKFYWKVVKLNPLFAADQFFTQNEADSAHRDWANYIDHLPQFPMFHPLDEASLKNRINKISEIEFSAPPIPDKNKYPDVENVQIVAYHRLVRFRNLVDATVGDTNRFWRVHRNPSWARDVMDFQLTEEARPLSLYTL